MTDLTEVRGIRIGVESVIISADAFDVLTGILDLYTQLREEAEELRADLKLAQDEIRKSHQSLTWTAAEVKRLQEALRSIASVPLNTPDDCAHLMHYLAGQALRDVPSPGTTLDKDGWCGRDCVSPSLCERIGCKWKRDDDVQAPTTSGASDVQG